MKSQTEKLILQVGELIQKIHKIYKNLTLNDHMKSSGEDGCLNEMSLKVILASQIEKKLARQNDEKMIKDTSSVSTSNLNYEIDHQSVYIELKYIALGSHEKLKTKKRSLNEKKHEIIKLLQLNFDQLYIQFSNEKKFNPSNLLCQAYFESLKNKKKSLEKFRSKNCKSFILMGIGDKFNFFTTENARNYLIENINKFVTIKNESPLHLFCSDFAQKDLSKSLIAYLICNKSDVNMRRDFDGNTPLHIFASSENIYKLDLLIYLIDNTNLNLQNKQGNTPLHCAASNKFINTNAIEMLLTKENM